MLSKNSLASSFSFNVTLVPKLCSTFSSILKPPFPSEVHYQLEYFPAYLEDTEISFATINPE